jgi:hypothetical protein
VKLLAVASCAAAISAWSFVVLDDPVSAWGSLLVFAAALACVLYSGVGS